jgi:hypothetical protein
MRLMIEEVEQNVGQVLFLRHSGCRSISMGPRQHNVVVTAHHRNKTRIFRESRARKRDPILVQNLVETLRLLADAGEAGQPQPVCQEEMI